MSENSQMKMEGDPVFIVGNSRSGTTLMARILKSHPRVYILEETFLYDELSHLENGFAELNNEELKILLSRMITIQKKGYYRKDKVDEYPDEVEEILQLYKRIGRRELSSFIKAFYAYESHRNGKVIAGDQTPRHVFSVNWLDQLFPESKFINMVRDPRAVLLSQKNKWKATIRLKQPLYETVRTKLNYHPITIALLWNRAIEHGLRAEKTLGKNRVKTVKFESLVNKPELIISDICQFLGIEFEKEMLNVPVEMSSNQAVSVKSGIDPTVADVWKNQFNPTETYICELFTKKYLHKLEYQISKSRPNPVLLLWYFMVFPIQIGVAFIMNITRIGNPITYISQRIMVKSK